MTEANGYEERYCLFLDILGFQSHVEDTVSLRPDNKHPMTFQRLKSALDGIAKGVNYREAVEISGESRPSSRRVTQFSDSVVVSYLENEACGSGVSSMLLDVYRLQLMLATSGILLRGAITIGKLYHDENLVFGPALNEAVTLEKLANYPRVILDGQILENVGLRRQSRSVNKSELSFSALVTDDFDGLYYVDYFNVHPGDFGENWDEVRAYLESLRGLIKGLANKRDPSIKVKHSWLRTKFNLMAEPLVKSGFRELGGNSIPEDDAGLFSQIKPF